MDTINLIDFTISYEIPNCRVSVFTTNKFKWLFYLYVDNYLKIGVQVDGLLHSNMNKARNLLTGKSLNEFDNELNEFKRVFSEK